MRDRVLRWRDRRLADRPFLHWLARFPPTRPIARRQAAVLFDLCAGFVYAQTLYACVQLRLFDLLGDEPRDLAAIAAATSLPAEGAAALLESAVGLKLLDRRSGGRFGLGMLGAALRAQPGIAAMVTHHAMLYDDLRDPIGLLRGPTAPTRLGAYWAYAGNPRAGALASQEVGGYTRLMAASQPMIADEVLAAYDFGRHSCLLDVGGGDGSFLEAVARQAPQLKLMLFDVPPVAAAAAQRLAAAGLETRTQCTGGDFGIDPLPAGADVISFVRVLHDHDNERLRRLLSLARAALPPHGTVVIAEPMADSPRAAAYFSLYLRAMGTGRPRTQAELGALLREAGFRSPRRLHTATPLLVRVLIAGCKS